MKRFLTALFVLLCISSVLFAFPKKQQRELPEPTTQEAAVTVAAEEPSQKPSSEEQTEILTSLKTLQTSFEEGNKVIMTKGQIAEIKELVAAVSEDVEVLKADNRDLNNLLAKEKGTKFFADAGLAFAFDDEIQYGITADMGVRIKSGFLLKTGFIYMLGDKSVIKSLPSWDIKNLTITATVGWEW